MVDVATGTTCTVEATELQKLTNRVKPILDEVAVDGLRAWLRTVGFAVPRLTRAGITEFVVKLITDGQLSEDALEATLIGFEEASNMRIYLFQFDDEDNITAAKNSLIGRLKEYGIPITTARKFAGDRKNSMSPVYGLVEGNFLRVKWAEEHTSLKVNPSTLAVAQTPVPRRAVLIADYKANIAELRLNTPESRHAHVEAGGNITAEAYYRDYIQKAADVLGCNIVRIELGPTIKRLVELNDPRIVRIEIDNHTNQGNYKKRTSGPGEDVRDDEEWQLAYKKYGDTWAWDAQSFFWLPKASAGFLNREVYTHINAVEGFVNVNADCSDEEVEYVVTQIRTR